MSVVCLIAMVVKWIIHETFVRLFSFLIEKLDQFENNAQVDPVWKPQSLPRCPAWPRKISEKQFPSSHIGNAQRCYICVSLSVGTRSSIRSSDKSWINSYLVRVECLHCKIFSFLTNCSDMTVHLHIYYSVKASMVSEYVAVTLWGGMDTKMNSLLRVE